MRLDHGVQPQRPRAGGKCDTDWNDLSGMSTKELTNKLLNLLLGIFPLLGRTPGLLLPASAAWAGSPCLYALSARRCPVFAWVRSAVEAVESHRLYVCAHCGQQVHICRRCDRGQIYCAGACAALRRHDSRRRAGARYHASHRGAIRHAARQRRWRARERDVQQNVTHEHDHGNRWRADHAF